MGKLENNLLARADLAKPWHKFKGRALPIVFKQQNLFTHSADCEGAAVSKAASAWARVEAKLLQLQALRIKESRGNPEPGKISNRLQQQIEIEKKTNYHRTNYNKTKRYKFV